MRTILFNGRFFRSMSVFKNLNVVIYRIRQQGLEVFLVNKEMEGGEWRLPQTAVETMPENAVTKMDEHITLEPIQQHNGETHQAIAVEGDWHDMPSLKSLIKQDVLHVTDKLFEELEKHGTYWTIKEAVKKVMPSQYAFLKELKEVVTEKNSIQNL